ncbi:NAD-dependent epimerase/dehydratase family protein [Devosia sp. MC521]|uniref:UDP-2-acetamido-2,6-beta-L-arabino-hexul-4-ose reductase n=1 Tax=Devosia sp. MC521 TaxID=2759954 RepID=UPI0015F824C0|nr:NAD-dependent epimerase/dehydratase family protein [Devosia sp. MC521]MBJ6989010.1 NAD-dependent epimerase/dehydratase family protein [Devosia sp. MC521]QMW62968.1 SDR family oxidoreductase [Devosia sp. MC521]
MTRVGVTGANGFIGKNVMVRLREAGHDPVALPHDADAAGLAALMDGVERVIHLAGVNRPQNEAEFDRGNIGMTQRLIEALTATGQTMPLVYASSTQAEFDNPYGRSKRAAEDALRAFGTASGSAVHIWRLPNVFGKWCRPNYNSVVATFCHNIARGLPISISDPAAQLKLVYVDEVATALLAFVAGDAPDEAIAVQPVYSITLGELAERIQSFKDSRASLMTGPVGTGLPRALHATYLSCLHPADFAYDLVAHSDPRGSFAEMLRTPDAGQFSFFTAHPGITRGGHYHHSKTEKFLVVKGRARFGFRHILTDETFVLETSDATPRVVETVPGWSHDITNIGDDTMVVMLWANEVFDRDKPDTIAAKVLTT